MRIMKYRPCLLIRLLSAFTMLAIIAPSLRSQSDDTDRTDDRTLSPYFWVKGATPGVESLPLRSTRIDANIAGVIADVRVTQIYANTGDKPIEAVYVFPGSTRAAVHGLTMMLGDRRVEAEIKERKQARQIYETALTQGKTASLLEQQRPNVFQMNLANILPGDVITVELRYTELLSPVDGVYTFVYPGVVGPRYTNTTIANAAPDDHWVANPHLPASTRPDPDEDGSLPAYDIAITLAAGVPIQDATCKSHRAKITHDNPTVARIQLENTSSGGDASNRDFILNYRLAGAALQAGLLLAENVPTDPDADPGAENYFVAMLQPPARPNLATLPPRDYLFIVDVSGSMHGFPIKTSQKLLRGLLPTLRPQDTFNLVLFSGDSRSLSTKPLPATDQNLAAAIALLERQDGRGGTELLPALQHAFSLPPPPSTSRTIAIITDGYVTVEHEAFELIRTHLGGTNGANVFAFGIGGSVNRHLIEGLARAGQGEPFIVTNEASAAAAAERFGATIAAPVLTRINVAFEGIETYDVEPPSVPDVFAQRPVILFGKWRGPLTPGARIVLSGHSGADQPFTATLAIDDATRLPDTSALSRLWARHRIAQLGDDVAAGAPDREDRIAQITQLGLTYKLLTRYTSFVAVDHIIRRQPGEGLDSVRQPLPLPQGVGNRAVGGDIPTSPEPATWALLGVATVVAGIAFWRRKRMR